MKRILALSLVFLMLAACVPTPKEEPVIHKNEGTLEQQLAATPVPEYQTDTVEAAVGNESAVADVSKENTLRKTVGAPETLTESFDGQAVGAHLYIEIDATVDVPNVEKVPVLRGQVGYEPDKAAERLTKLLIGDGPYIRSGYHARDYAQVHMEYYQKWIDALDQKPYGQSADYDALRKSLQRHFDTYAKNYREDTGEDDRDDKPWTGSFSDAKEAFVIGNGTQSISIVDHARVFTYDSGSHPSLPPWQTNARGPRNEQERQWMQNAVDFANSLGYAQVQSRYINDPDEDTRMRQGVETGYESGYKVFYLLPVYEGIPLYPYTTNSGSDTGRQAAGVHYDKDLKQEEIFGTLCNGEVVQLQWDCPFTVTSTENENVPLLSFERIMEIFRRQVFMGMYLDEGHDETYRITSIEFSYMRVKVQNSDEYYLLPVWDFLGYTVYDWEMTPGDRAVSQNFYRNMSILTINAVDGSIIDRNLGY